MPETLEDGRKLTAEISMNFWVTDNWTMTDWNKLFSSSTLHKLRQVFKNREALHTHCIVIPICEHHLMVGYSMKVHYRSYETV